MSQQFSESQETVKEGEQKALTSEKVEVTYEAWNQLTKEEQERMLSEAQETLKKVHEWTRHADFKVSPFLAGTIAILTFVIKESLDQARYFETHPWVTALVATMFFCFVFSVGYFVTSIQPRLTKYDVDIFKVHRPVRPETVFFFGHVSENELAEIYRSDFVTRAKGYELLCQYLDQIYVSSLICRDKYTRCAFGIQWLAGGLVLMVVCGLSLFFEQYLR